MHPAYKANDELQFKINKLTNVYLKSYDGTQDIDLLVSKYKKDLIKLIADEGILKNIGALVDETIVSYDLVAGFDLENIPKSLRVAKMEELLNKTTYDSWVQTSRNMPPYLKEGILLLDEAIKKGEEISSIIKRLNEGNQFPFVTYADGKKYPTNSYLRMYYRTTQKDISRDRSNQIATELGTDIFEYSSHGDPREQCSHIQGKLVSYSGSGYVEDKNGNRIRYYKLTNYGYGTPGGAQGINCSHIMFPFVAGVSIVAGAIKGSDFINTMSGAK